MKKITQDRVGNPSELGLSWEALIQRGARQLIQRAIEAEVTELLAAYENVNTVGGLRVVVRTAIFRSARC